MAQGNNKLESAFRYVVAGTLPLLLTAVAWILQDRMTLAAQVAAMEQRMAGQDRVIQLLESRLQRIEEKIDRLLERRARNGPGTVGN